MSPLLIEVLKWYFSKYWQVRNKRVFAQTVTNNYACSLPPLANGCFWVRFADHVNPQLMKWHQWKAPIWLWEPDMAPTVYVRLVLVMEYCPFVGTCTLNSTICVILLLCLSFCHQPPHPHTSPARPSYVHWPNINEFHDKIIKTGENQPLSTCQVSCTKANWGEP